MTKNPTKIFYSSREDISIKSLFNQNESQLPHWTPLSKIKNANQVRKIVAGTGKHCLIWKGNNNLEFYQTNQEEPKCFTIENEEIQDIQSGHRTYLILTKSGKVFSLAENKNCYYCEIPLSDPQSSTFGKIREVPFFNNQENNRKVKSLAMISLSNYFLCKDGKLYGNGYNRGNLGDGTSNYAKNLPVLIFKDVTRVFGGVSGFCFFLTTKSNELYACGENEGGSLGIGNYSTNLKSPVQVPNWKADDILDLQTNSGFSILITKEGKTYGCGSSEYIGFAQGKSTFTEIEELKNHKVTQYCGGDRFSLALTNENELFGWGFEPDFHPTNQYGMMTLITKPEKLDLPKYFQNNPSIKLKITGGMETIFIYPSFDNNNYLHHLYKDEDSKDFTLLIKKNNDNEDDDDDEYEEIAVHKIVLIARSGLFRAMFQNVTQELNSVKDYSGKTIDSIEILIKYLYTDKIEITADHDPLLVLEELEDSIEYYQLNENSNILVQLNEIKNKL